jgi:hypothetical protein
MNNVVIHSPSSYRHSPATSGVSRRSKFVAHSHVLMNTAKASRVYTSSCVHTDAARPDKLLQSLQPTNSVKRTKHTFYPSNQPLAQGNNAQAAMKYIVTSNASNTSSSRMKKLAAANVAMQAKQAAAAAADPSVTVSLSIGSSSSSSSQANQSNTAAGSSLTAGGNINLIATGADKGSNILIQGSTVKAGQLIDGKALERYDADGNLRSTGQVNLQADNDITLQAAKNVETQTTLSMSKPFVTVINSQSVCCYQHCCATLHAITRAHHKLECHA